MNYNELINSLELLFKSNNDKEADLLIERYLMSLTDENEKRKIKCDACYIAYNDHCYSYWNNHIDEFSYNEVEYIMEHCINEQDVCEGTVNSKKNISVEEKGILCLEDDGSVDWENVADNCEFALETINGSIIVFSKRLQMEAFKKFLKKTQIKETELIEKLDGSIDIISEGLDVIEWDEEDYEPIYKDLSLLDFCKGIGICVRNRKIVFHEFSYLEDEDQYETLDVLKALGWKVNEIGENSSFIHDYNVPEVYYILK